MESKNGIKIWQDVIVLTESLQNKIKEANEEYSDLQKQLKDALEEKSRLHATIMSFKKNPCNKCAKLIECTEMLKKKLKEKDDTISVIGKLFINQNPESYALASQMVNEVIASATGDTDIFDNSTVCSEIDTTIKPNESSKSPVKEQIITEPPTKKESPVVAKKFRNNKRKLLSVSSMRKNKLSNGETVPSILGAVNFDDDDDDLNEIELPTAAINPIKIKETCDNDTIFTPLVNPIASPEILCSMSRCDLSLSDKRDDKANMSTTRTSFKRTRRSSELNFDANADNRETLVEFNSKTPETVRLCEQSAKNDESMDLELAKAIEPLPDLAIVAAKDLTKQQLQQQRTIWNLKRSRELTNKKLKQTLLSTVKFEKKVDISTSSEYKGGSTSPMAKKLDSNSCNRFLCKENVDETFFEPPITSTHNDYDKIEPVPAVESPAKGALAESTNKPRTPVKIDDSFDCLPSTSPKYKYKRDAVRKKSDRMKLPGQECSKCLEFYSSRKSEVTNSQMQKLLNKCSRHRDKYPVQVYTPPGLWNPVFEDTDEEEAAAK